MADLSAFSLNSCPKCKGTDLKPQFAQNCPTTETACGGLQSEHLHFECMTCRFRGAMQTADAATSVASVVKAPVVAARRKKDRHA
jgi:hypothetical protein